jgi:hypothetical protein
MLVLRLWDPRAAPRPSALLLLLLLLLMVVVVGGVGSACGTCRLALHYARVPGAQVITGVLGLFLSFDYINNILG